MLQAPREHFGGRSGAIVRFDLRRRLLENSSWLISFWVVEDSQRLHSLNRSTFGRYSFGYVSIFASH
jgi:hypothetical protein